MVRLSNTREQIVDRARDLLQSRGFDGFSYNDISSHLGIRNAAVHYHFRSKEDLGLALVKEAAAEVREQIRCGQEAGISPREQFEFYLNRLEQEMSSQQMRICPVGALSVNYGNISAQMQSHVTALLCDLRGWMARILEQGRQSGEFSFRGSSQGKAELIMSAVQGVRQIARIMDSVDLERVTAQIRAELYS
jgi:TetR/AcrR family transcriptional repressor of nem operon